MAGRRRPNIRTVAITIAVVTLTGGCGSGAGGDPLQVSEVLTAAAPATSPQRTVEPAGRVLTHGGGAATATVVDPVTGTLAVALTDRVLLYRLADLDAAPRTVDLPGRVDQLDLGGPGELLAPVPDADVVLRIAMADAGTGANPGANPGGNDPAVRTVPLAGGPTAATVAGGRLVVALADAGAVAVLDGDRITHQVQGFDGAADLVTVGDRVAVLDRPRTAIATIDPATGRPGPALRAGNGAANAVGDRFGRVLVTDLRDGELLAFTAEPMIMRQRYPVPGAPYAIAYDAVRDLAWVTLTERNEVVGLDVAGGEPVERYRLATVRQPDAVAVDSGSGTVVVVSGTGEGIQVVRP